MGSAKHQLPQHGAGRAGDGHGAALGGRGIPVCLSLTLFFGLGLLLMASSPPKRSAGAGAGSGFPEVTEDELVANDAVASTLAGWCAYGSLTGYWTEASEQERHWRVLDPGCAMRDLVEALHNQTATATAAEAAIAAAVAASDAAAAAAAAQPEGGVQGDVAAKAGATSSQAQTKPAGADTPHDDVLHVDSGSTGGGVGQAQQAPGTISAAPPPPTPSSVTAQHDAERTASAIADASSARVMFLSDSVDRHILGYLCTALDGHDLLMNPDGSLHTDVPPQFSSLRNAQANSDTEQQAAAVGGAVQDGASGGEDKGGVGQSVGAGSGQQAGASDVGGRPRQQRVKRSRNRAGVGQPDAGLQEEDDGPGGAADDTDVAGRTAARGAARLALQGIVDDADDVAAVQPDAETLQGWTGSHAVHQAEVTSEEADGVGIDENVSNNAGQEAGVDAPLRLQRRAAALRRARALMLQTHGSDGDASGGAGGWAAGEEGRVEKEGQQQQQQQQQQVQEQGASGVDGTGGLAPSQRVIRHYQPHVCSVPTLPALKLMDAYIPGVHLTGPFHRNLRQGWQQQMADAANVWQLNMSDSAAPDVVVLGSCLWDLARLSAHEPAALVGAELPREVLDTWVANFTRLVMRVRTTMPQTTMIVYHTAMMPRFDPHTGLFEKQHLGRRFYVTQLNAAGMQVANQLGLEVLDYAALAGRFMEGQAYLADAVHPGAMVGMEVANILLNYVHQTRQRQRQDPHWQHPSMWLNRGPALSDA